MDQINLYGKIVNGEIKLANTSALKKWASMLGEGSDIVAKFTNQADYKTVRQLRLLYYCYRKLAAHIGESVSYIKTMMKLHAGLCFSETIEGKEITICKSVGDMTKIELSEFIEFIDIWASRELNFPLLSYDDKNFLKTV